MNRQFESEISLKSLLDRKSHSKTATFNYAAMLRQSTEEYITSFHDI